jgi:hypothetical protein
MSEKSHLFLSVWASPLLAALLAPLAGLAVYLFLSLKREMRVLARRPAPGGEASAALRELTDQLEEVRTRLSELERGRSGPASWNAEPEALNLNRRGQILRLHRKGKPVSEIATALHIPLGEVELMVKVYDLSQNGAREKAEALR